MTTSQFKLTSEERDAIAAHGALDAAALFHLLTRAVDAAYEDICVASDDRALRLAQGRCDAFRILKREIGGALSAAQHKPSADTAPQTSPQPLYA